MRMEGKKMHTKFKISRKTRESQFFFYLKQEKKIFGDITVEGKKGKDLKYPQGVA
jgi:hypothetical protein